MTDLSELQPRLEAFLRRREPHYFDLLKRMVAINSYTANHEGVRSLARLTAEAFARLGFESESIPSQDPEYTDHLVMTRIARNIIQPNRFRSAGERKWQQKNARSS